MGPTKVLQKRFTEVNRGLIPLVSTVNTKQCLCSSDNSPPHAEFYRRHLGGRTSCHGDDGGLRTTDNISYTVPSDTTSLVLSKGSGLGDTEDYSSPTAPDVMGQGPDK